MNVGLLVRRCAKFQTIKYSMCVFIKMSDAEVSNDQDEEERGEETHKVCDNI